MLPYQGFPDIFSGKIAFRAVAAPYQSRTKAVPKPYQRSADKLSVILYSLS